MRNLLISIALLLPAFSAVGQQTDNVNPTAGQTTLNPVDLFPQNFVSFNPWSGLWREVINLDSTTLFAQEVSFGRNISQSSFFELGIIFGQGKFDEIEPNVGSGNMIVESKDTIMGVSGIWFFNTKVTPKTVISFGPRFAYLQSTSHRVSSSEPENRVRELISSVKYIEDVKVFGAVGQFEYFIDQYLSFGLRYSFNHKSINREVETELNSSDEIQFTTTNVDDSITDTAFDGAHITIRW